MSGLIKMYCYRMFRQFGIYIIWGIITLMMFIDSMVVEEKLFSTVISETGSFVFLLASVWTAVFFSTENSSGFIKNYAGSVSGRGMITAARTITALIIDTLTICIAMLTGFVFTLNIGNAQFAAIYLSCLFLTTFGTSCIALLVSEIFRKTVPVVIITIAISSSIVSELFGSIFAMLTDGRFVLHEYCVTGMYKIYCNSYGQADALRLIIVSLIYVIITIAVSIFSIKKRDAV